MKKKPFLTIAILCFVLVCLTGCGSVNSNIEKTNDNRIRFWTDEETGIQYVIYADGYRGGITPRLNTDGSIYVVR